MRKFLLAMVFASGVASAQIKISQLPAYPQAVVGTEAIPMSNPTLSTTLSYGVTPQQLAYYILQSPPYGFYSTLSFSAAPCTTTPSAGCQAFGWFGSISGSYNGGSYAANQFSVHSDSVANTTVGSPLVSALEVDHNFGSSTFQGQAVGFQTNLVLTSPTGNLTPGTSLYLVGGFTGQFNSGDGGTGTGTSAKGSLFGLNPNVRLLSGATYINQIVGEEIDEGAYSGSSVNDKIGLSIVQLALDAVTGSRQNNAIQITNQALTNPGWAIGLSFGNYSGYWPIASTGTLIGCSNHAGAGSCGSAANGIDFSNVVLSGYFLNSVGFSVDGSGNEVAASVIDKGAFLSQGTKFTLGTGTGGCATTTSTGGGTFAGQFTCTGSSGTSTQIINLPTTLGAYHCSASDATSGVAWANMGAPSPTTEGKISGTLTNTNDVVTFSCTGF
jgi:hypothetical protein